MAIKFEKKPLPTPKSETIEVEKITATTSVEVKNGSTVVKQQETEETLAEILTDTPMANIGFTGARTFNLGNYNSAKVQVSLHYPCYVNTLDETYEKVRAWVDEKMEALGKELEV